MSDRFRDRLGLREESERSKSPSGTRSPRRMSRSPRPHGSTQEPAVAVTHPLVRNSHPEIAAWPAPPENPTLSVLRGNVRTPVGGPVPLSPVLSKSPVSQASPTSSKHELDNSTLLSVLKVASMSRESSVWPQPDGRETELKRKIRTLEDTVAEYERQKYNVMGTFSEYRERVAERERKLEAEYSGKIIALSEEVLGAKKDFEARMKSFQALQDKFEREKEQALEKLRKEHQKEIQLLEQRFSDTQILNLEQKYILEIQRLEEERKSLRAEKERLGETFEMKLRRAQSLYETELAAAKMLYTRELEALRDHEEALKDELLARQDEFHDRLQELQLQSKRSREDLAVCKNEVNVLEKKLHSKEKEVQAITKELDEVRHKTNENLKRLSKVTAEFSEYKQKFQQQEEELRKKARLLSVVEAAKEKLESVISDLQIEVKALKNKVKFLEKERNNLQSQSESQAQLQSSQVDALEAVLDNVTKEKEATKEHYENLLLKERQQSEAREHSMKKEFSSKLNELEEQYTSLKEELEESARLDKDELRESTQNEIHTLKAEKDILEAEVRALSQKLSGEDPDALTTELARIVEDTTRLTNDLQEYRDRINSKDEEISSLRKRLDEETSLTELRTREVQSELMRNEELHDENNRLLQDELDHCRSEMDNEKKIIREKHRRIKELEEQNTALHEELDHMNKALEAMENDIGTTEAMKVDVTEKERTIESLTIELNNLRDELGKRNDDDDSKQEKLAELQKIIDNMKTDNDEKTNQIEKLNERINDMTAQVDNIKNEVQRKTDIIEQMTTETDQNEAHEANQNKKNSEEVMEALQEKHTEEINKMNDLLRAEHEKMDSKENRIKNLEELVEKKENDVIELNKKLDELTQQLNEETTVVLLDNTIEQRMKEKEDQLAETLEALGEKNQLIESMSSQLEVMHKKNEDFNKKLEELTFLEEERLRNQATTDIQTDDLDINLKLRLEELEASLERKNEFIQQLQGRLSDEISSESGFSRKRSSITSHGVFQNFVSQMKDKREEANERNKKKEAEKKAEKEKEKAAREIAREKSPARSKSPSLLTRLRDRSPAKSKSPNLETTPSTSTRNLLSPSDAERRTERSSPSRSLFSKSKKEEKPTGRPAWKI